MRAKSLALLVLALGCGLVASIGITQVMARRTGDTVVSTGETETIFVAMQDVPLGEPLTSQVLRLEQWPKDKIPSGAITRIEDIEGRRTRARLFAGEPILENKLFGKGVNDVGSSTRIPKGYRVVPIKVDATTGGADLICPGDRVDLLLFIQRNPQKNLNKTITKTILQDVKVFAVNNVVDLDASEQSDKDKTMKATTISLLVTPEQAERVALAAELGRLRLVMRSPEDDKVAEVEGAQTTDLFDGTEAADRRQDSPSDAPKADSQQGKTFESFLESIRANAANAATATATTSPGMPSSPGETWAMRLVIGPEIKDVVLEAELNQAATDPSDKRWKLNDPTQLSGPAPATDKATSETPAAGTPQASPTPPADPIQPKEADAANT